MVTVPSSAQLLNIKPPHQLQPSTIHPHAPTQPTHPPTHPPQARCPVQRRVQVPNLTGRLPLAYAVLCDLDCLEGPEALQCTSTRWGGSCCWAAARHKYNHKPPATLGTSWVACTLTPFKID
jgi:hypothetical protein